MWIKNQPKQHSFMDEGTRIERNAVVAFDIYKATKPAETL